MLIIIGGVGATGWLTRNWMWLLAAPVIFLARPGSACSTRSRSTWRSATTSSGSPPTTVAVCVYKANSVEANKALRQIQRARERHQEQYEP